MEVFLNINTVQFMYYEPKGGRLQKEEEEEENGEEDGEEDGEEEEEDEDEEEVAMEISLTCLGGLGAN